VTPLAVGVDIVEVERIAAALERHPERFLSRHFTPAERADCRAEPQRFATRWAAKEAVAKALGTGVGPVGWREIEVRCHRNGAPRVVLHGAAAARASALGLTSWRLSLSHTAQQAIAMVVAAGAGDAVSDPESPRRF
jgi:holo-[acyl-carrier protein] synthase